MSNKHLHLLQAIYHDPPSANIHWREIESLLLHLGATVEAAHGARFRIVLNKVDVPEAKELADFVRPEFEKMGLRVFEVSTASHAGLKELGYALGELVTQMRKEVARREQEQEDERVVIKETKKK